MRMWRLRHSNKHFVVLLRARLFREAFMAELKTTLLNDTSSYNHHGCSLVVGQIREQCKKYGLTLWYTVKLGDDWRAERHRKRLAQSDIVIVNGEGTLHHDRKSARILAQSAAFCRAHSIPCFLINSVYQANGKEMADLVRQFDLVFVRESRSQAELRREGIDSDVVPDMTLSHPDLSQLVRRNGMLVTDSSCDDAALQLHHFYTQTDGAKLATLYAPVSKSRAFRMLAARWLGNHAPKRWRSQLNRSVTVERLAFGAAPREPVDALFNRISSTSLIVTGRFHMVCMAMLARTPFVALQGNTHKIEGLLADANLSNRYCPSLCAERDPLIWSNWNDHEAARLEAYLQSARSRISQMFSRIRQFPSALAAGALLGMLFQ